MGESLIKKLIKKKSNMVFKYSKIKKEILNLAQESSKYCVGMEGNVSGKIGNNFLIKCSGSSLMGMTEKDLVLYNFFNEQKNNFSKKGSMEVGFHSFLLGYENINFITHTHPVNTLKILCSNDYHNFANKRFFPDQVIFNGIKSCVVPYAKPGDDLLNSIKVSLKKFIDENNFFPKLFLLVNHGIICCGSTVKECIMIQDICEKSAEIYLGSKNNGLITYFTKNEILDLVNDNHEKYRHNIVK